MLRTDYDEYLQSPEWKAKRDQAHELAKHRCQLCNSPERLHVHHRTYERIGQEDPTDLTVLCDRCHANFHDVAEALPTYENGQVIFRELAKMHGGNKRVTVGPAHPNRVHRPR